MSFAWPWLLCGLPLALLPWWARPTPALSSVWPSLMPRDPASEAIALLLRIAPVLALVALVVGAAGPHQAEYTVASVGRGAEIVLVLDRSRSMDQPFAVGRGTPPPGANPTGPEALAYYTQRNAMAAGESKGQVARRLLADFAAQRTQDRFGMVAFSTVPIRTLAFTHQPEAIQAAIAAGNVGRGLSDTDIGLAVVAGLSSFDDRPYSGSRLLMLVSDGGDTLDAEVREHIAALARRHRVAIYWLYIRSALSPGLNLHRTANASDPSAPIETMPEVVLHRLFSALGTPYQAYEAEDADALQRAIADVNRLENGPINRFDTVPRRDLSHLGYSTALACVLLLLAARLLEVKRWA